MESSYKKLARLRDETHNQLIWIKKSLEHDAVIAHEDSKWAIAYALEKVKDLFKLYEIE